MKELRVEQPDRQKMHAQDNDPAGSCRKSSRVAEVLLFDLKKNSDPVGDRRSERGSPYFSHASRRPSFGRRFTPFFDSKFDFMPILADFKLSFLLLIYIGCRWIILGNFSLNNTPYL